MSNLYWPVYKSLEREVLGLSDLVHFDDHQMSVYSVKISELLIRCAVEIESISKDLFIGNGGLVPLGRDLYFDTDCLSFLEEKWLLSKKKVMLSSVNFYVRDEVNRVLTPLHKSFKRGTSGSNWKRAYQAVKHERVKSLSKGNVGNLIAALGALYILNLYYKNEVFELNKDSKGSGFSPNCGSDLFSIVVHHWAGNDLEKGYVKKNDFDEAVYYIRWTQKAEGVWQKSVAEFNKHVSEAFLKHPKVLEFIANNDMSNYEGNFAWEALGQQEYIRVIQQSETLVPIRNVGLEYEAVLNFNDI